MIKTAHLSFDRRKGYRHGLILILVVGVAIYLIVPQLAGLDGSWSALRHADRLWAGLAVGGLFLTYLLAAGIYLSLGMKRLSYGRTVLLQMASMFAGRLLPAGVGSLGINYLYLRRQQHSAAQAGAVVAANNTLGFVGNVLLVTALLLATSASLPSWQLRRFGWWMALAAAILLIGLVSARHTRLVRRLSAGIRSLGRALAIYGRRPRRLLLALACSIALTATYALILYASSRAVGPQLPFGAAAIVMTIGVAGATVTPTPGGIGGAEAALAAALALYHISATDAVAIAVLYRVVTYWLGLFLGGLALLVAERRRYI